MNLISARVRTILSFLSAFASFGATANALTVEFNTDPFDGSPALSTPGRQIVGGEISTTFSPATDVFLFNSSVFPFGGTISFANDVVSGLPTSGVEAIVLQTFDNDANAATTFGAGSAANLIADQITSPGAGLFVYFNSNLDVARLVYSTDLNDNTADLKVLAQLTNLTGQAGRDAFPLFTAANFQMRAAPVPEPASILVLIIAAGAIVAARSLVRRKGPAA